MSFEIKILGSSSAIPAYGRNHSAQVVSYNDKVFLIDCGEGTQHLLKKYKVKINKINAIFISHLHGDHFLGLFGLLSSMSLLGRSKELLLFGPKGLDEIITVQLKHSQTIINYPLEFRLLEQSTEMEEIAVFTNLSVSIFPLKHRILCNGFRFQEVFRPRKILRDKIKDEDISKTRMRLLKSGKDICDIDGNIIYVNGEVTENPPPLRSYCYCSDTAYFENLHTYVQGASLLYHETSFLNDMQERAHQTCHSTTRDAALVANEAEVKNLVIGHFSGRYKELDGFIEEIKPLFENSELAIEGKTFTIEDPL